MKTFWKNFALILVIILVINSNVLATNQYFLTNLKQEPQENTENNVEKNTQIKEQTQEDIEEENAQKLLNAILNNELQEVKNLIGKGVELNDEESPFLLIAAMMNSQEIVAALIQAGADINSKSGDGTNVLAMAVLMGHTKIVNQLISLGATPTASLDHENSQSILSLLPFMFNKDEDKYLETLQIFLLVGANPNEAFGEGKWTLLMDAASQGYKQAVELLIQAKVNVNAKTTNGITPCLCAQENGHLEIVKLLKKAGANCLKSNSKIQKNTTDNSKTNLKEIILELRNKNADDSFNTGLFLEPGQLAKAKHLIAQNNIDEQDENGNTPLMNLLGKSASDHLDSTNTILDLLIEANANVNIRNPEGDTALLILSRNPSHNFSMIGKLISAGADIKAKDFEERTPLISLIKNFSMCECLFFSLASTYFANKAIEDLVRAGIDINAQDSEGKTALMYATSLEEDRLCLPFVKTLLEFGADPNIKDNNGKTAFEQKDLTK